MKKDWEEIGSVAVDSGQLMVCDPCYVDAGWKRGTHAPGHDPVGLTADGKLKFPELKGWLPKFPFKWGTYASPCPDLGGLSINEARKMGLVKDVKVADSAEGQFSYRGCCLATCSDPGAGELEMGFGVAFSSGHGDGRYPVYARKDSDGRIVEVRIKMD